MKRPRKLFKTKTEDDVTTIARHIAKLCDTHQLFLFTGDLGAGKTTLIKHITDVLGVKDLVNSPTYSIVNEYQLPESGLLYHFDLYRLNEDELYDIGFDDYLVKGKLIFIEWPDAGESFYPDKYIDVRIRTDNEERVYEISKISV